MTSVLALLLGQFRRDICAIHADFEGVVIVMKDCEELVGVSLSVEVDLEGAIKIIVDSTETE